MTEALEPQKEYRVPKLITKMQRDFWVAWKETGLDPSKIKDCLRDAGYGEYAIKSNGHQVRKSIGGLIKQELDKAGLTGEAMAREHYRLAFKSESAANPGMPDNSIRLRAIQEARRLKDDYPVTKLEVEQHSLHEHVVSIETIQRAARRTGENIIDLTPEPEELELEDADATDRSQYLRPL